MDPLVFLAILLIISVVCVVVSAPFRGTREPAPSGTSADAGAEPISEERAELEAERDAKYREIRDAELDHRTGKLSDEDFEALERSLRAEAVEILRRLDALERS